MKNNKPWARAHVGKVVSIKRWSDTHVSSSGGGGYIGNHGGVISAPQVYSSVEQKAEVFSVDENGKEQSFELGFSGVSFREGSNILAVWGDERGKENGSFLYVENLDTYEKYKKSLPLPSEDYGIFNGFFLGICASIIFFVLSNILIDGYYQTAFIAKNKITPEESVANAKMLETLNLCPQGTSFGGKYNPNDISICPLGILKLSTDKRFFNCDCESEKDLRKKLGLRPVVQNNESNIDFIYFIKYVASFIFGIVVWVFFSNSISEKYRKKALLLREQFINQIKQSVEASKDSIKIESLDPLVLNRA